MIGKTHRNRRSHRGYLLLEMLAAAVLVMTLVVVSTQMIEASAHQRLALRHRQAAMEEAANLLERIAARPWSQLTPAAVAHERLSDDARQALPGGALSIELRPEGGPPAARQVLVTVAWREAPGREPLAVRLAAWRFQDAATPAAGKGGRP
jgi:Tfp pilus assembly protein PilX